jgi:hypothetical protein
MRVRASSLNYRDLMVLKGGGRGPAKIGVVPLSDGAARWQRSAKELHGSKLAIGLPVAFIRAGLADRSSPTIYAGPLYCVGGYLRDARPRAPRFWAPPWTAALQQIRASPRIRTLREIRDKIRPEPVHEPLSQPRHYAPPRAGRYRRRP